MLVTALATVICYDKASRIAHFAIDNGGVTPGQLPGARCQNQRGTLGRQEESPRDATLFYRGEFSRTHSS
jgi:hypothetical protein